MSARLGLQAESVSSDASIRPAPDPDHHRVTTREQGTHVDATAASSPDGASPSQQDVGADPEDRDHVEQRAEAGGDRPAEHREPDHR